MFSMLITGTVYRRSHKSLLHLDTPICFEHPWNTSNWHCVFNQQLIFSELTWDQVSQHWVSKVRCWPRNYHLHVYWVPQSFPTSGPLFTKRTDVLPQDLVKSRSLEIWVQTFPITLKFERLVKFQSDMIITTFSLAASRLHEIWRKEVLSFSE